MTQHQVYGLGTLMTIGAVLIGYIVYLIVPTKHFPIIAGVLAADAVMGALAFYGVDPAGEILVWFLLATGFIGWIAVHVFAASG